MLSVVTCLPILQGTLINYSMQHSTHQQLALTRIRCHSRQLSINNEHSALSQAVTLLNCILEIPGSNIGRNTEFHG